jgi:hypothetical protein
MRVIGLDPEVMLDDNQIAIAALTPGLLTTPSADAVMAVPRGPAQSSPLCMVLRPVSGWRRMPKPEVWRTAPELTGRATGRRSTPWRYAVTSAMRSRMALARAISGLGPITPEVDTAMGRKDADCDEAPWRTKSANLVWRNTGTVETRAPSARSQLPAPLPSLRKDHMVAVFQQLILQGQMAGLIWRPALPPPPDHACIVTRAPSRPADNPASVRYRGCDRRLCGLIPFQRPACGLHFGQPARAHRHVRG